MLLVTTGWTSGWAKPTAAAPFPTRWLDDRIDSAVLSDGAATYHHGLGLVSESRGGTSTFYHADALGSTRKLTDSSQNVSDTRESDAFGNVWQPGTTGANPTPFGYAAQHGYQSDADSGLMRLGYRYYDASVGRFLSRDPIQDGRNWYTYCDNDPVNAVDPEGLILTPFPKPKTWLDRVEDFFNTPFMQFLQGVGRAPFDVTVDAPVGASVPSPDGGGGSKAKRTLEKRIRDHEKKLEDYRSNPDAFDNDGRLRNAPSDEIRQRIIDGRIRHLESEIKTFKDNIDKLK